MNFDLDGLDAALERGDASLPAFRDLLNRAATDLETRFRAGQPASRLVAARSRLLDQLLMRGWGLCLPDSADDIALVAVGGYGRGELLPHSDVDILILAATPERHRAAIEKFVTFLWDIGLQVGHSVRTPVDCGTESAADVTVMTNLMEARLLAGPRALFEAMRERVSPAAIWPSREFFNAKRQEQLVRHRRYHDTAYRLEPNVKESPGGLRDIHTVAWVAKRHFNAITLHDLVDHGFLTEDEHALLLRGQEFLWRVRFALHVVTRRREDRLLFDYQSTLAKEYFGYVDGTGTLAVEQFMREYYRTVKDLSALNEMLLQLFQEAIDHAGESGDPTPINRRFQSRHGFIETTAPDVFARYPYALLEVFLLIQQHPELQGIRATTLRQMRAHLHLIDDRFRADLRARSLFMEMLRQPHGITHELRRMNRHGVLGAYLAEFGQIVGLMQYDLFHVYTVDEHTLMVVRNLRRLTVPEFMDEFPQCSQIFAQLPKPELIYVAGLYHDIAKGRGGDHSQLGAEDARAFCQRHGLSHFDTELVVWLVRHHLFMSTTIQKRDISDPAVVSEFTRAVRDGVRLDYLYLLTVADVRATNPSIWNSWKDTLLWELYTGAKRALRRGLEQPIDLAERIRGAQAMSRHELGNRGLVPPATIEAVWARLDDDYFLRYQPDEIVVQTEVIAEARPTDLPVVLARESARGSTDVFIYSQDADHLFAVTTAVLDQLGLTVVDARIITSRDGYTLDTYSVLEADGAPIAADGRLAEIQHALRDALRAGPRQPSVRRRTPRQYRLFPIRTTIEFSFDEHQQCTVMELITGDRPGLLAQVGAAFGQCGVRLHNARIATFGSRAEDVFFISAGQAGAPVPDPVLDCLRQTLGEILA